MPRPKIRLPYSLPEKLMRFFALAILIALVAFTAFSMNSLPNKIPTHFGVDGRPDGWGGKDSLLTLPIVVIVLYVPLSVLERFPWLFNYPCEITEENAANLYKLGRQTLEWVNLLISAIFSYIQWQTLQTAKDLSDGLGFWFLPVFLLLLFGGIGWFLYKMMKQKNEDEI